MNGVLTDEQIAEVRQFFLANVSGRGPLPAVKIGRQPYGILPTTVLSRLAWPATATVRTALNAMLTEAAQDWQDALVHVASLDEPGADPHQTLLDILALHPTSAEYHFRYAQSVEAVARRDDPQEARAVLAGLTRPVHQLLTRFGWAAADSDADPDLLRRLFDDVAYPLVAPVVDDRPLSETDLIRPYTTDGRDYLTWLAESDLDTVHDEQGFVDDLPPSALLYLLARHAVLLGWTETARRLALAAPGTEAPDARDAPFVHVRTSTPAEPVPSESRYRTLYSTDAAITEDPDLLVHEFIRAVLPEHPAAAELSEQAQALTILAGLPTARLERVFAEHLDCATYRLDAWRLGLVNERLAELRYGPDGTSQPAPGLHLGAYGWIEHVTRNTDPVDMVDVPADLTAVFGTGQLPHDRNNGGYVHTPSPAHARTAALLRAGYLANAEPAKPNLFAVNLSSERVRLALTIGDGMRQGQSLGALLGYRFERGLHDRDAGLDKFIAGLRMKFPLRANKIDQTTPAPDDPAAPTSIEQVEARNVIDGLALLRHVNALRDNAPPDVERPDDYPFGFTDLEQADQTETGHIRAEVAALRNALDAVADLAVAEGAHQALQGNTERASAALDAYAKEGLPPSPAVVETPRSGTTLTHRLALQLTPGLGPDHGAPALGHNKPRAQAEPAVNDWLPAVLPKPENVAALVTWRDQDGNLDGHTVTQVETELSPIDLLWALHPADQAAMTDLDDRILGVAIEAANPRPDFELHIEYTTRVDDKITFFEVSPLVAAVRTLLTTSRPLRQSDLTPAAGSAAVDRAADDAVSLPRERPAAVLASMNELVGAVAGYITDLGALYPDDAPPQRSAVLNGIDTFLTRYAKLVVTASGFGLLRSGWGELALWRRGVFADVLAAVAALAARMADALAAADALLDQGPGPPEHVHQQRQRAQGAGRHQQDDPERAARRGRGGTAAGRVRPAGPRPDPVPGPRRGLRRRPAGAREEAGGRTGRAPGGREPGPAALRHGGYRAGPGPRRGRRAEGAARRGRLGRARVHPARAGHPAMAPGICRQREAGGAPQARQGLPGRRLAARDGPGAGEAEAVGADRTARGRAARAGRAARHRHTQLAGTAALADPTALRPGRPLARPGVREGPGTARPARRGPAAVHRALRDRVEQRAAVRATAGRVDRGDPRRARDHGGRPALQRTGRGTAAGHAAGRAAGAGAGRAVGGHRPG